jgi:hypothetical protein
MNLVGMSPNAAEPVEIDNRLWGSDERKRIIDEAIRAAFQSAAGDWRVTLTEVQQFSPPSWCISIQGRQELLEMSLRSSEQHPDLLRERLLALLHGR